MKIQSFYKNKQGFTLIELLTVIAIIGILAGIIIPVTQSVRISAKKAKSKVQFSQWAAAMGGFKQEYGYYPNITTSGKVASEKMAGALTGRDIAGTKYSTTTDANLCGNKRLLSFYTIADSDLNDAKTDLVDAFGNTDIVCFIDSNGDGRITAADTPALAQTAVASVDNGTVTPTNNEFAIADGVRAGVIFYSAGHGKSTSDIVLSWK